MSVALPILWLGEVPVDVLVLMSYSVDGSIDWAEHKVIEGSPKLQWMGIPLATRRLTFKWHGLYCTPETWARKISKLAADHQAIRCVWGTGKPMGPGWHVIQRVNTEVPWSAGDGSPLIMAQELELLQYAGTPPRAKPAATAGSPLAVRS